MNIWSHSSRELEEIARLVSKTKRQVFVELGCYKFNMTIIFTLLSLDNPLMISVDKTDYSPERRQLLTEMFGKFFKFVLGNTHDPAVIKNVEGILRGRKIDILFVDGDHTAGGMDADAQNFLQYMDPEGYIIWHDITRSSVEVVHQFVLDKLRKNIQINLLFDGTSRIGYIKAKEWLRNTQMHPDQTTK